MQTEQTQSESSTDAISRDHDRRDTGGGEPLFTVLVNEQPVKLLGYSATGLGIKTAAIEQGVQIQLNFLLEEESAAGTLHPIEDDDRVELRLGLRFVAQDVKRRTVSVLVNEQPVKLHGRWATGAEIKAAAIDQGVRIQPNFVLQEELPNGTSKVIGDDDRVHLREHLRFTAIAPDDNS